MQTAAQYRKARKTGTIEVSSIYALGQINDRQFAERVAWQEVESAGKEFLAWPGREEALVELFGSSPYRNEQCRRLATGEDSKIAGVLIATRLIALGRGKFFNDALADSEDLLSLDFGVVASLTDTEEETG